ncbi:MAG: hypothetical protein OEL81_05590 [Nitrosopumilus sp.]|nr:hypothetical protein [Nitrosopumilus sp.]
MTINSGFCVLDMTDNVPLYVIGLPEDDSAKELLASKFGAALEKVQQILPDIIESKIAVKSQNTEGTRTHYDVTATVITSKNQLLYTDSGWDILKIADELCRKLDGELSKHDDKRQRDSIRKKEST